MMRAMGQSRFGAVVSFLLESLMIGVIGGAVGAVLGSIPATMLEKHGFSFSQEMLDEMGSDFPMTTTIYGDLTPEILLAALVIGIVTAVLGALLPALRASTIPPYEAMRSRR